MPHKVLTLVLKHINNVPMDRDQEQATTSSQRSSTAFVMGDDKSTKMFPPLQTQPFD